MWTQYENQANELGLKYYRLWGKRYFSFLVENGLNHNTDLMIAYYNRVVLNK